MGLIMSNNQRQSIPVVRAAGVIQPPVKTLDDIFTATRATVAQLEAERDARELVAVCPSWSPAQMAMTSADLPAVGKLITDGMGLYRVVSHVDETRLRVVSHTGVEIVIDYANSGYRDPINAWREVSP